MMRAILILSAMTAAFVGAGAALFHAFQEPPGGGGATNPQVEAVLSAIDLNLSKLGGSMTAELAAVDSSPNLSFVGGQLRAKGLAKLRIDKPTGFYVHDNVEFNVSVPGLPRFGLRWDDSSGGSISGAASLVGLVDHRAILKLARWHQAQLVVGPPEVVNGVLATKLSCPVFTLYVDAAFPGRILRAAYNDGHSVVQGDFGGWTQVYSQGGELPTTWLATNSLVQGSIVYKRISYTLSNLSFGIAIPDSVFATAGLPGP